MSDQEISCNDCGDLFVFSQAEQNFYAEKGLASPPKRCKACRQARKSARPQPSSSRGGSQSRAGGGGGYGQGGPRRYSNDVNEYRSPMTGGHEWQPTMGMRNGNGSRNGNGNSNSNGNGNGSRAPRGAGAGYRSNGYGDSQGQREYRSPSFPDARAPRGPRSNGPARGPGGGGGRFGGGGQHGNVERAARPERPRFDITCEECGVEAQVPFKPLEGRQVFCQECYRARRSTAKPSDGATEVLDTDAGIIE